MEGGKEGFQILELLLGIRLKIVMVKGADRKGAVVTIYDIGMLYHFR